MSQPFDTDRKFWLRLGFGGGVSVALFLTTAGLAISSTRDLGFLALLEKWQTIIAGLLALIGAYLTVAALERQLEIQRQQSDDQRRRKHYAARAALPAALSDLVQYTRACETILKDIGLASQLTGRIIFAPPWVSPTAPLIPHNALQVLQTCIESADEDMMAVIAGLIEDFQVMHARLLTFLKDTSPGSATIVTRDHLNDRIIDTLEFDLRCGKMFEYARRRSEGAVSPTTREELSTRAFFEDIHDEDFPGFRELVDARFH